MVGQGGRRCLEHVYHRDCAHDDGNAVVDIMVAVIPQPALDVVIDRRQSCSVATPFATLAVNDDNGRHRPADTDGDWHAAEAVCLPGCIIASPT